MSELTDRATELADAIASEDWRNRRGLIRIIKFRFSGYTELIKACEVGLDRLERSYPPKGGDTDLVCKQIRAALTKTKGK